MNLIIPENYDPVLSLRQTQKAIKYKRYISKRIWKALMLKEFQHHFCSKK